MPSERWRRTGHGESGEWRQFLALGLRGHGCTFKLIGILLQQANGLGGSVTQERARQLALMGWRKLNKRTQQMTGQPTSVKCPVRQLPQHIRLGRVIE